MGAPVRHPSISRMEKRVDPEITNHSNPNCWMHFTDKNPTTTIAQWKNGETILKRLKGKELEYWLNKYTLGALYKSGELEQM